MSHRQSETPTLVYDISESATRQVSAPDEPLISLEEVFEAYYECRRHKRHSLNALRFEVDLEDNLVHLWRDLNNGTYQVGRSVTFIVSKPVLREIFAADFRDRIVHHLIIRKLLPFFERRFSPHSYSCRKGMGTLYGVRQVQQAILELSDNYTHPVWVMKLDLRAFFMSIRPDILYRKLEDFITVCYSGADKKLLLSLVRKVVFNRPQRRCIMHGDISQWQHLPWGKSLFHTLGTGLPIGNLTSQIFANFYLTELDDFITSLGPDLRYGRYVDDFVVIHKDPAYLLSLRPVIQTFLSRHLGLSLNPKKFYMQPATKGVPFVGVWIKPHRLYVSRRLKGSIFNTLHYYNRHFERILTDTAAPLQMSHRFAQSPQTTDLFSPARLIGSRHERNMRPSERGPHSPVPALPAKPHKKPHSPVPIGRVTGLGRMWCVLNSYLGMIRHYQTYRLRRKMLSFLSVPLRRCFLISGACQSVRPMNRHLPDFCRYRKKRRYVYSRSVFDLPGGQSRYIKPCWRKE